MAKQATKAKKPVKNEQSYTKTITFKYEPTYEERESMIKRAIYIEQEKYKNKPFRFIVVDKDMTFARIKFFVKGNGRR